MNFAHLHVHTCMSPDGLIRPHSLPEIAKNLGHTAIAVTDHGTASSYVEFFTAAQEHQIKPIFGNEMYYDYWQNNGKLYHITVLAKTKTGYENIIELNNAAHRNIIQNRGNKFPPITAEMMAEFHEDLIVLTGCPASVMHEEELDVAYNYVEQLVNIFGEHNVFIETMFTMENQAFLKRCLDIEAKFHLPMVLTNDAHFSFKEEAEYHSLTVLAKKGFSYESSELYVKSTEEVYGIALQEFKKISPEPEKRTLELMANTVAVADSVESFEISHSSTLPEIPPFGFDELRGFLLQQLDKDKKINEDILEEIDIRFNLEWKVINDMKLIDYFYIVFDIKRFAEAKKIFLRLRGSGAGSYLLYLLGISPVHPIRFPLRFDRFLNYERHDYPDVDMDVEPLRRKEIFDYAKERWGMIPVSTFMEYSHKSTIHDIARVLGTALAIAIPKQLEIDACELGEDSEKFAEFREFNPIIPRMYDSMIGTIRQRGKHAAAVASPVAICPIECWGEEPALAFAEGASRKELSLIGLVKLDILGVDALDKIAKLRELCGPFSLDKLNKATFDVFSNEEIPIDDIFQFKSSASIKLARMVKPETLDDIAAIVALNRPGPLDAGTAWHYAEWKESPRKLDPRLDVHLARTYGVLVFQEQVMDLYSELTGEGAAGANDARKILCPKSLKVIETVEWQEKNNKLKENVFKKGIERGFSTELLEKVWEEISTHARYSFNAAHSYSYAYNALEMAYYKANFPVEFYFSLVYTQSLDKIGKQKVQSSLYEAAKAGVKIIRPDINVSRGEFVMEENSIYLPLSVITGCGTVSVEKFLAIRDSLPNKKFESLSHFAAEVPKGVMNKTVRLKLFLTGAFDSLSESLMPQEIIKILGIDPKEYLKYEDKERHTLDWFAMQIILPSKSVIRRIEKFRKTSRAVLGYVIDTERSLTRTSKRPTVVHYLFPYGKFTQFDSDNTVFLDTGTLVGVEINQYQYLERNKKTNKWLYQILEK